MYAFVSHRGEAVAYGFQQSSHPRFRPHALAGRTVTDAIPHAHRLPETADPGRHPTLPYKPLEVAFIIGSAAAGNVEDTFEMRNTSSVACWVFGYVGFQTLDLRGRRLPQTINWSPNTYFGESEPPSRIVLPAGTTSLGVEPRTGHAFFNLFTNDVLCDFYANPVASIEIWPPDEHRPLTIPATSAYGQLLGFCGGFQLNPLQIQPLPRSG